MPDPTPLDHDNLPAHVAIIMDGNGRWAQKRGLLRTMGHKAGVDSVREIVKAARELGIRCLTLYAFSTENWNRPESEVSTLMSLLKTFLERECADLHANQVRLRCIGQIDRLPDSAREVLEGVMATTRDNTGLTLVLALSYGSRSELTRAVRSVAAKVARRELDPAEITEGTIASHLDTAGLPDPDLLIRTGGEARVSNFLLWQCSYSEIYFTPIHWPDFRREAFIAALADYQGRQRRFGKTGEQAAGLDHRP